MTNCARTCLSGSARVLPSLGLAMALCPVLPTGTVALDAGRNVHHRVKHEPTRTGAASGLFLSAQPGQYSPADLPVIPAPRPLIGEKNVGSGARDLFFEKEVWLRRCLVEALAQQTGQRLHAPQRCG